VKRSYRDAWQRVLACLIGIVYAVVIFRFLGYHPWSMALLLLVLLPTLVKFKAQGSVTTACVIILHMYVLGHINPKAIFNELQIIVVGIGFALLMNSYMPSRERELVRHQHSIEENFRKIFHEIARFLREGETDWAGEEITETENELRDAQKLALHDIENQVLREEHRYSEYFLMRGKQFEILERIMLTISTLDGAYRQGHQVADFLDELSKAISPGNRTDQFLDALERMREDFKQSPLPQDRKEFENRATLHHFVHDMERYLMVKKQFFSKNA
jgi:uncharacterized membrane protein YgaE (UPF0421/DUF939 family)